MPKAVLHFVSRLVRSSFGLPRFLGKIDATPVPAALTMYFNDIWRIGEIVAGKNVGWGGEITRPPWTRSAGEKALSERLECLDALGSCRVSR